VAAVYFPPSGGTYEVKHGLKPLGADLGNGSADGLVFQLDAGFPAYRRAKLEARAERLGKYYRTEGLAPKVAAAVGRFMAGRLAAEHPELFGLEEAGGGSILRCALTGETLRFDREMRQVEGGAADPPYTDPIDALACQVQEDVVVVRRAAGKDWTAAIHLCFPYRWTAEGKIGQDFVTLHLPVPHMEGFRRPGMVTNMIEHGPYTRFVWDLTTDDRLNHHPEPPPGIAPAEWRERPFEARCPRLYMRVEREVVWGFPEQEASLFTIRTSFRDGEAIRQDPVLGAALASAIESMSPESLRYKGLAGSRDEILGWLRSRK
jgi:hypothetical protein